MSKDSGTVLYCAALTMNVVKVGFQRNGFRIRKLKGNFSGKIKRADIGSENAGRRAGSVKHSLLFNTTSGDSFICFRETSCEGNISEKA
jgi:hypothetical protein